MEKELKPNELKRETKIINFRYSIYRRQKYSWCLHVFESENEKPFLSRYRDKEKIDYNNIRDYVNVVTTFIDNYDMLAYEKYFNKFIESEFIKVIYDIIKYEVIYERTNSIIIEKIKEKSFKIDEFKTLINNDIKEITSGSFVNIELLNYLHNSIKTCGLLSNEVLLAICFCTDYETIKNANIEILKHNKEHLTDNLKYNKRILTEKILEKKQLIKENRKALKRQIVKKVALIGLTISILTGTICYAKNETDEMVEEDAPTTYMTTYTTYSSIASQKEEKSYEILLEDNSPRMKVYEHVYLEKGELYRKVKTYRINDFTNIPYKYYDFDLSIIKPDTEETIKVKKEDYQGEYREILKITQDMNDSIKKISTLEYILSILLFTIFFGILPIFISLMFINFSNLDLSNIKEKYSELLKEVENTLKSLKKNTYNSNELINRLIPLCDEIIGLENFDSLNENHKKIILDYIELRGTYQNLYNELNEEEKVLFKMKLKENKGEENGISRTKKREK